MQSVAIPLGCVEVDAAGQVPRTPMEALSPFGLQCIAATFTAPCAVCWSPRGQPCRTQVIARTRTPEVPWPVHTHRLTLAVRVWDEQE